MRQRTDWPRISFAAATPVWIVGDDCGRGERAPLALYLDLVPLLRKLLDRFQIYTRLDVE